MSDRFQLLGALGRGGTATVHLADDTLRGHHVALKVVHPHLADDPAVQRRLRREVAAASLIQHEAALVPYDLHEVDGALSLSMPWHPGETLADRVARTGPLAPDEVRALGQRLAGALAASHRAGVLHRDVSAANVLLESPNDAVLTDFGLARVTKAGTQGTTGLLGTAGYAAPEVYSGVRSDPRSDLYGLGAVLYLAATGRPAFDPRQPMAALKAQLDDDLVPVRDLAPGIDDDVARAIEAMLRADPEARPDGARTVLEWMHGERPPSPQASSGAPAPEATTALGLPDGDWTLLIVERSGDRMRRDELRAAQRGRRRSTFEEQMSEVGRHIAQGLLGLIGLSLDNDEISPEQLLADAVADEAGLAPGTLAPNVAMLDKRFRLVDRTDEDTARRLRARARAAGFDTEVHRLQSVPSWVHTLAGFWWMAIFPLLLMVQALPPSVRSVGWMGFVFLMVIGASFGTRAQVQRRLSGRAIAFRARGAAATATAAASSESSGSTEPAPVVEEAASEGQRLRQRAVELLDALDATLEAADHLPEIAQADLRATSRRLRDAATRLAVRHDALSDALASSASPADQVAGLASRLARLDTLQKAGKRVDAQERARLEAALAQHTADEAAAEQVESELIATQAQLIELASTASRVRRELVQGGPRASADELVARLRREADALERARREAASKAVRRQ